MEPAPRRPACLGARRRIFVPVHGVHIQAVTHVAQGPLQCGGPSVGPVVAVLHDCGVQGGRHLAVGHGDGGGVAPVQSPGLWPSIIGVDGVGTGKLHERQ